MTEPASLDEQRRAKAAQRAKELATRTTAPDENDGKLDWVNARLRMPDARAIVGCVQRGGEYDLPLADGSAVKIADAAMLMHPQKFEAAVAQTTAHVIPENFNRAEQKKIAQALLDVRTVDTTAGDEEGETREWIAQFLGYATNDDLRTIDLADRRVRWEAFSTPHVAEMFLFERRLYVARSPFHEHVIVRLRQRSMTAQKIGARMARIGFERPRNAEGKITATEPGGTATRTIAFYASQPGFDPASHGGDPS